MERMQIPVGSFFLATTLFIAGGCGSPNEAAKQSLPAGTIRDSSHTDMTASSGGDAQLRTPGGKYTAEDIKANGELPPMEKYKGIGMAAGPKAKAGDRVCPDSGSKSNPNVTWVVGGKTYEFCCPSCIGEFVKTAKEKPDAIMDPSEYVKK